MHPRQSRPVSMSPAKSECDPPGFERGATRFSVADNDSSGCGANSFTAGLHAAQRLVWSVFRGHPADNQVLARSATATLTETVPCSARVLRQTYALSSSRCGGPRFNRLGFPRMPRFATSFPQR